MSRADKFQLLAKNGVVGNVTAVGDVLTAIRKQACQEWTR
jgi:hypothetical protein